MAVQGHNDPQITLETGASLEIRTYVKREPHLFCLVTLFVFPLQRRTCLGFHIKDPQSDLFKSATPIASISSAHDGGTQKY